MPEQARVTVQEVTSLNSVSAFELPSPARQLLRPQKHSIEHRFGQPS
jgi:hypothetical protein